MLSNLFGRRGYAAEPMQSPDATTSSRAPAPSQEYATLGAYVIPQAGPAASRLGSPPSSLSPVVRAAAQRIAGSPLA
ncbi:MAG: hypothetical protein ACLGI5_11635 [Thermoleophilia bacterium]